MKICYLADLNLPDNKSSIQYDALCWALGYIIRNKTDNIVLIGNMATKDAMPYLTHELNNTNIPYTFQSENKHGFKPLDPDMAKGEYPSITFFDTDKNEYKKVYYFCPVPTDIYNYLTDKDTAEYEINSTNDIFSYSTFFKLWAENKIKKAPIKVNEDTLELFNKYKEKRVFDIHSHTYYSNCGRDNPRDLIETAIKNGISVLGISDHSQHFRDKQKEYREEIRNLANEYKDRITVLLGIEIPTLPHSYSDENIRDIDEYDYSIVEHLTEPLSIVANSFWDYRKKLGKFCGVAHTDLFEYCDMYGYKYEEFFRKMAENNVFWEMNVTYDSIHKYKEHQYVFDFIKSPERLKIIRDAGVYISIGLDTHNHEEYYGYKAHEMYDILKANNIKTADILLLGE